MTREAASQFLAAGTMTSHTIPEDLESGRNTEARPITSDPVPLAKPQSSRTPQTPPPAGD